MGRRGQATVAEFEHPFHPRGQLEGMRDDDQRDAHLAVQSQEHLAEVLDVGRADAVLAASIFHDGDLTVGEVKSFLASRGIPVRRMVQRLEVERDCT